MRKYIGVIIFMGFTIAFIIGFGYCTPKIDEVLEIDSLGDEIPEEGLEDLNEIYWPSKDSIIRGYTDTI